MRNVLVVKAVKHPYLTPKQLLGPLAKLTSQLSNFSADGSSQRSGLNLYGSGNIFSS